MRLVLFDYSRLLGYHNQMVAIDPGKPEPRDTPEVARSAIGGIQSEPTNGLTLVRGRHFTVKELAPLIEQVVKDRKYREIGHGMEYRVYETEALEGVVFKLESRSKVGNGLLLTPRRLRSKEAASITKELTQLGFAASSVSVDVTIPVESCRTGMMSERTLKVVVQQKLEAVEHCWHACRSNRSELSKLARDIAVFHRKLVVAGYIDTDLNCVKNVGYVTKEDGTRALQLLDLGFVYRLPNERTKRGEMLAAYGDARRPTIGEFLVGSLFDRFYGKARKHRDVAKILKPLIGALFPGLSVEDMVALHAAYIRINREIRTLPREERVAAYMSRIRAEKHAQLMSGVFDKLVHEIE